jgi:hypothetical protein
MVHESQGLALGFKTCQHLFGVHSSFDELQCDLALDGLQLLGLPTSPIPPAPSFWRRR